MELGLSCEDVKKAVETSMQKLGLEYLVCICNFYFHVFAGLCETVEVYSIWVCMGMDESSMAYVHLTKDDLLGSHQWENGLDL